MVANGTGVRYSCIYYCHAGGYERVQPLVYCCRAALLHYSHTPGADINNLPSGPECPPARDSCPMHTLRIGRPPLSCEKDADCALNEKCCVDDCVNQQVCTMAVQRPSQHTCLSGIQHPASACSHNAAAARTSDVETDESSKDDENYFINVKGNHNSAKDNIGSFKNDRASIVPGWGSY
ncbi:uncharacterized protein [Panulirus ornatus]|uniref:uncharacterized protein isoform X2 n=1 Tax=Panulirus ornatus TaxID=150431 RepID=UPI003A84F495